jgi:hypothetical protein
MDCVPSHDTQFADGCLGSRLRGNDVEEEEPHFAFVLACQSLAYIGSVPMLNARAS